MFARAAARAARIMTPRVGRVAGVAAVAAAAAFVAAPAAAAAAAPKVNGTAVPYWGKAGTKYERTFIAVKPDGVQRELIPEVMKRFQQKGFKLVGAKLIHPTEEMAREHYSDLAGKPFFAGLTKFFSSGPVFAMCWEGKNVIKSGRVLLGATNPADSAPGTIRGDFCVEVGRNVCHGSDGADSAEHELKFWFKEGEICNWKPENAVWIYE